MLSFRQSTLTERIFAALWLSIVAVLQFSPSVSASEPVLSDSIPIEDGVYFTSEKRCSAFHKGDVDFIDFSVEKSGREIGLPEAGCIVASVRELRPNRYLVESDCIEAGDPWEMTSVIDVLGSGKIRIDGEDHFLCKAPAPLNAPLPIRRPQPAPSAMSKDIERIIEDWAEANEGCRGGYGDDPQTDKACERRAFSSKLLAKFGYCFGKDHQSISEYEWHKCQKGSIRTGN